MANSPKKKEFSEDEMLEKMSGILSIDQSSIRRAYEGDKDGLTQIFNLTVKAKAKYESDSGTACILGAAAAFGLFAIPPVGAALGVVAAYDGMNAYQAQKNIDTARQTVLARLGQK